MKINLLQLDLDWADPEKNRNKAEEMMKTIEKADVYILPEMFSTGFATVPEGIAESWINNSCSSHQWMQSIAKDLDAALNDIRIVTGQSVEQMAKFAVEANKSA
jgi:predicted amidohydrolase